MGRRLRHPALAALLLLASAAVAQAAVNVGTLAAVGDVVAAPVLFTDTYNSGVDNGGLEFTIGTSGRVQLDFAATRPNVSLIAAALGGVFATPQSGPISLITPGPLAAGTYGFNLSALVSGGGDGGVSFKLTLTPIPAALALFGSAAITLGFLGLQRRHTHS